MIVSTVKGNLITNFSNGKYWGIVHGCNCFNIMGAGIAKSIKDSYPAAFYVDKLTIIGDKLKLGNFTSTYIEDCGYIINMYTQYRTASKINDNCIDYRALQNCFYRLDRIFNENIKDHIGNKFLGIPQIGAGLAGGVWDMIFNMINIVTPNMNIELVIYGE